MVLPFLVSCFCSGNFLWNMFGLRWRRKVCLLLSRNASANKFSVLTMVCNSTRTCSKLCNRISATSEVNCHTRNCFRQVKSKWGEGGGGEIITASLDHHSYDGSIGFTESECLWWFYLNCMDISFHPLLPFLLCVLVIYSLVPRPACRFRLHEGTQRAWYVS